MENARIEYFKNDLKMAELKKELIVEAISTRLLSGSVTADQLAALADVLKDAEGMVDYRRDILKKALGEENGEPDEENKQ